MKAKRIVKDIVIFIIIEAIVVGVIFFFSRIAMGGRDYSGQVSFDVSQSMLNENTEYIGIYIPGNKNLTENTPEIPGYRSISKNAVAEMNENSADNTMQFSLTEEQTALLKDKNVGEIIIVFMNGENGITLKSQNINLKIIPHVRDISWIYLSNNGIELNYTYKLEELTAAAVILTGVFYASRLVSRNKEEKQAEKEKTAKKTV